MGGYTLMMTEAAMKRIEANPLDPDFTPIAAVMSENHVQLVPAEGKPKGCFTLAAQDGGEVPPERQSAIIDEMMLADTGRMIDDAVGTPQPKP